MVLFLEFQASLDVRVFFEPRGYLLKGVSASRFRSYMLLRQNL